jgi:hypothetical protein
VSEMDLINRYVYAVTKSLPEKQREDIEKELKALINDMVEENDTEESYESKVKNVLLKLGDPELLADNYRGAKRYLIGPQNYDKYILLLKIVSGAVFIGISIAVFIGAFFLEGRDLISVFTDYIGAVLSGLLQGFAWTTVAFAIAERHNVNVAIDGTEKGEWNLSKLPKVPEKKAMIPPAESIFAILFSTIFISILFFAPQLFAAYIPKDSGVAIIPIFNFEVLLDYKMLFLCIYILSVLREALKLFLRRWTLKLSISFTILSIASTILMLIIFTNPGVWNVNFPFEVAMNTNLGFDFNYLWERVKLGFIIVMIAACIMEVATALYKGIKYNVTR